MPVQPVGGRVRPSKNAPAEAHVPPSRRRAKAVRQHQRLSMDFVHDQLFDGRRFRILTVIDEWSRESVILAACRTNTKSKT